MIHRDTIDAFAAALRGPLLEPGDPGYDEACALHNGMIHKHPLLIAAGSSAGPPGA